MATETQLVIEALKPLENADLTTSALRVLGFTAIHEAEKAYRKGDYAGAQQAAMALCQACAELFRRPGGRG